MEVVEKLLAVLKDTPLEAFNTRDEKDGLIHALDRVYENLEKEPVLALEIIKTDIMTNLAVPSFRNGGKEELIRVLPLLEALTGYLSLQHAS